MNIFLIRFDLTNNINDNNIKNNKLLQINLNLGQNDLVDFCKKNNRQVVAYTPFGKMVPSRNDDSPAVKYDDPIVSGIAKKHGKTVTQIALRYLVSVDEFFNFCGEMVVIKHYFCFFLSIL